MDRNFWDPTTPPGFIDLLEDGSVVELCIYSFPLSTKDRDQVRADVEEANRIWCQRGINVQAIHWERLDPLPPVTGPLDLNSPNLAGQIPSGRDVTAEMRNQLFGIGQPNCPRVPPPTNPVPVYYIPETAFGGGGNGRHLFRISGPGALPEHIILLTNSAPGRVLAHELGHALFTRQTAPNTWITDDPDPSRNVEDRSHNTNPLNLMFPRVATNPVISPEQAAQAELSSLRTRQRLRFGFREDKPFKMAVRMKTLNVHKVSDEAFSDDALESTWNFRVKSGVENSLKIYENNRLTAKLWDLPTSLDFDFLNMAGDDDKLIIQVTGEDWDFWSPNDPLPEVNKEWPKGNNLWGSGSTDLDAPPGTPLGDHTEHRENDEIKYSLTYNIRVHSQPVEEIFRNIC